MKKLLVVLALALSACAASEVLEYPETTLNVECAANQFKLCDTWPASRRLYSCWCTDERPRLPR